MREKSPIVSVSLTLLLAILKVTDARRDVIMARGLHRRFHLPPESIGGRPSGPSPCAFPLGAWYLHVLLDAVKTVWTSAVFRVTNKNHENIVAKKGHSYSLNYAQLVQ